MTEDQEKEFVDRMYEKGFHGLSPDWFLFVPMGVVGLFHNKDTNISAVWVIDAEMKPWNIDFRWMFERMYDLDPASIQVWQKGDMVAWWDTKVVNTPHC